MTEDENPTGKEPNNPDPATSRELAKQVPKPNQMQVGSGSQIDLEHLTPEQQQELRMIHAKSVIELNQRAQELGIEVKALDHTLETATRHTSEVASEGGDVTITHTQESALGRTEVIMGTSDAAKRGKLSRSQTGQADNSVLLAGLAAVIGVLVLIAFVIASKS